MGQNSKNQYRFLHRLTTQELEAILDADFMEGDDGNTEMVFEILKILHEREGLPAQVKTAEEAWEEFKLNYSDRDNKAKYPVELPGVTTHPAARKKNPPVWRRLAAAAAVVCILVLAAPLAIGSENIFTVIAEWTSDFFRLATPGISTPLPSESEIKSIDNPDLKKVYGSLVEKGVPGHLIPKWIPDEFELESFTDYEVSNEQVFSARFIKDDIELSISISSCVEGAGTTMVYPKDDVSAESIEMNNLEFFMFPNASYWSAVWMDDNYEFAVFTNLDKDTLLLILNSI